MGLQNKTDDISGPLYNVGDVFDVREFKDINTYWGIKDLLCSDNGSSKIH